MVSLGTALNGPETTITCVPYTHNHTYTATITYDVHISSTQALYTENIRRAGGTTHYGRTVPRRLWVDDLLCLVYDCPLSFDKGYELWRPQESSEWAGLGLRVRHHVLGVRPRFLVWSKDGGIYSSNNQTCDVALIYMTAEDMITVKYSDGQKHTGTACII